MVIPYSLKARTGGYRRTAYRAGAAGSGDHRWCQYRWFDWRGVPGQEITGTNKGPCAPFVLSTNLGLQGLDLGRQFLDSLDQQSDHVAIRYGQGFIFIIPHNNSLR